MSQATEERRRQIMVQLLDKRHVTVKELAASMEVSGATVRRDLKALADEEELLLVHGGATLPRLNIRPIPRDKLACLNAAELGSPDFTINGWLRQIEEEE